MRELTMEQVEYAVARLRRLIEFRDIKQTQLDQWSGVTQSTISKVLSRSQDSGGDKYTPSEDVLRKLFHALGLKLSDILNESDSISDEILGYLATPLTALTEKRDGELRRNVARIRAIAADKPFRMPSFEIYWPGDHTHPRQHPNLSPSQVYVTDRSRASTYDFIILFCTDPSYGLGQENEIATQAGVPAIRFAPENGLSRMMTGSFIRALDIRYFGTLETSITFSENAVQEALQEIRKIHFSHRALYRGINRDTFGTRLKTLVIDRCGDYAQFAKDLGISLAYLHNLMEEPFAVSNPSARLLERIAVRLNERVAYLLGESEESDAVWIESNASWRQWISSTDGINARLALQIRDEWRNDYRKSLRERQNTAIAASFRNSERSMKEIDWDKRYQKRAKGQAGHNATQQTLV